MRYEVQANKRRNFRLVAVDCDAKRDADARAWPHVVRAPFSDAANPATVLQWAGLQVGSENVGPLVERFGRETFHVCTCGLCR